MCITFWPFYANYQFGFIFEMIQGAGNCLGRLLGIFTEILSRLRNIVLSEEETYGEIFSFYRVFTEKLAQ